MYSEKYENLLTDVYNSKILSTYYKLLIFLFGTSGIPVKDMLKIQVKHINFNSKEIILNKEQVYLFTEDTKILLQDYIKILKLNSWNIQNEYICQCTNHGQLCQKEHINYYVVTAGKKVGYHITPRLLRQSFIVYLINKNVDIAYIRVMCGYKWLSTLENYIKCSDRLKNVYVPIMKKIETLRKMGTVD